MALPLPSLTFRSPCITLTQHHFTSNPPYHVHRVTTKRLRRVACFRCASGHRSLHFSTPRPLTKRRPGRLVLHDGSTSQKHPLNTFVHVHTPPQLVLHCRRPLAKAMEPAGEIDLPPGFTPAGGGGGLGGGGGGGMSQEAAEAQKAKVCHEKRGEGG